MEQLGTLVGIVGGCLGIFAVIFAWVRGGFKKSFDSEEALKDISTLQVRAAEIDTLSHRVHALEKDSLEIKRNYQDSMGVLTSKIDDMNKHILDLTFKLGTVVGQNGRQ